VSGIDNAEDDERIALADVQKSTDQHIAIIDEGKLKGFGTLDQLKQGADSLESLFVSLVGGSQKGALSWL